MCTSQVEPGRDLLTSGEGPPRVESAAGRGGWEGLQVPLIGRGPSRRGDAELAREAPGKGTERRGLSRHQPWDLIPDFQPPEREGRKRWLSKLRTRGLSSRPPSRLAQTSLPYWEPCYTPQADPNPCRLLASPEVHFSPTSLLFSKCCDQPIHSLSQSAQTHSRVFSYFSGHR